MTEPKFSDIKVGYKFANVPKIVGKKWIIDRDIRKRRMKVIPTKMKRMRVMPHLLVRLDQKALREIPVPKFIHALDEINKNRIFGVTGKITNWIKHDKET